MFFAQKEKFQANYYNKCNSETATLKLCQFVHYYSVITQHADRIFNSFSHIDSRFEWNRNCFKKEIQYIHMKNPVHIIKEWFELADETIQKDLYSLVYYAHPKSTGYATPAEQKVAIYEYLDDTLSEIETVQRVALTKGLINMMLADRKSAESWEKTRERTEIIGQRMKEADASHDSQLFDDMMSTFDERKEKWIAWGQQWDEKIGNDAFDNYLAEWMLLNNPPKIPTVHEIKGLRREI
jgi:hypothetical protein